MDQQWIRKLQESSWSETECKPVENSVSKAGGLREALSKNKFAVHPARGDVVADGMDTAIRKTKQEIFLD